MKPINLSKPHIASGDTLRKMQQAISQQPQQPAPVSLGESSATLTISSLNIEDSLAKALLPDNYTHTKNGRGLYEVQTSYVSLANQKLSQNNESLEKLTSIAQGLAFNSSQAHTKVRDMFSNLGALTTETDHLLIESEKYVYSKIHDLHNVHADSFNQAKAQSFMFGPRFEFEVKTQEGDTVTMSYGHNLGALGGVMSRGVQLEMQVDGDISEQESEALTALYKEVSKYIEQTWQSDGQHFAVTSFNLEQGFDSNVLAGFDIQSEKVGMHSSFSYEIDKQNNEQRLQAKMDLSGDVLHYDLDITTALGGGKGGKEEVLASLANTLAKMDSGLYMDKQVNAFILDSFSSLFANESRTEKPVVDLTSLNQSIGIMDSKLEGAKLTKLSELADYQFSLKLSQLGTKSFHDSTIKMGQDTKSEVDTLGKHVSQKQTLDITMYMMRASINSLKGHETNWRLDQEETLDVTVDHEDKLRHHKASGHHEESLETKQFVDNILKHTFAQQVDRQYSKELEVLESTAKLTTTETDKHKAGLYSRIGDKPKDTLAESRYIREYRQVQNYESKDKL